MCSFISNCCHGVSFAVGKKLASLDVTDKGEEFLDVEAVASDDSIDGVMFKLTRPDGSGEEQFEVCWLLFPFPDLVWFSLARPDVSLGESGGRPDVQNNV